jgi:hypothetical protein
MLTINGKLTPTHLTRHFEAVGHRLSDIQGAIVELDDSLCAEMLSRPTVKIRAFSLRDRLQCVVSDLADARIHWDRIKRAMRGQTELEDIDA